MGRPDGEDLPGDVRAGLEESAKQLRAIRNNPSANPLVAVNEFFRGVVDVTLQMLESLAQPRGGFGELGTPAKQLLGYLANHKPESHAERYKQAVKAVDEIKKNPAYALGKAAPGAVAMAVGAKVQLAAELNAASKELLAANATTNRIVRLEQESLKAAKASGVPRTPPRGTPDPGLPPGERPVVRDPTTLPPTCWMNQCLRNSIQVAKWRRSGNWVEPVVHADVPASRATVVQEFEKAFGGERAVDPLHGAGGQQAHALGLPVYSSRERIEAVMRELREHGNGIVLVEYENGGHIFNVYGTPDGRAVFYDHHYSAPPPPNVWASARTVSFFRVP